jgi:hypothetical protein
VDVKNGRVVWETQLATSVQGFPITFAIDGRQYVAVATGLGGGSPRSVPAFLSPGNRGAEQGARAVRLCAAGAMNLRAFSVSCS